MMYERKISKSIEDVDVSKWDEFSNSCFLKSDTLRIIENLELGKNSFYLEVFYGGELVAIAVFYGQYDQALYYTLDQSLYGVFCKYVRPFLGLNPSILCYFPYAPSAQMYQIDSEYDKKEIFDIIVFELEALAKMDGYKSYAVIGVTDETLTNNAKNLFRVFSGYKIKIKIKGKNFEDFVNKVKKGSYRSNIRRDRKLFFKSDYSVEKIKKLEENKNKVLGIFKENLSKYGNNNFDNALSNSFIRALDKYSNRISYFLCRHNKKIICAVMIIEDDSKVFALRGGQKSSDENARGAPFFNTAIYEPLIYAIENFKKSFELGTESYEYKIRRGAKIYDSYNFINSTNKFKNLYLQYVLSIIDKRNRKKHLGRLHAEGGLK